MKAKVIGLLVGLLFILLTAPAIARKHKGISQDGPIYPGPLAAGRVTVVQEAQRLGMAQSPVIVEALARFDRATKDYAYDLGMVYECQTTGGIDTLAILQARLEAFTAINTAIAALQQADSTLPLMAPINGVSHVDAVTAVEQTWPALTTTAAEVLQAAGIGAQVEQIRAMESEYGGLSFELGTANHWAIQHPAAREIMDAQHKLEVHLDHMHQERLKNAATLVLVLLSLVALWFGWQRRKPAQTGQAITV